MVSLEESESPCMIKRHEADEPGRETTIKIIDQYAAGEGKGALQTRGDIYSSNLQTFV